MSARALAIVLRNARLLALGGVLGLVVAATLTIVRPRKYTASASFITKSRSQTTNLAGLAMQFGVSLPTSEAGQSPAFYGDLLETREILSRTASGGYAAGVGAPRRSLAEHFAIDVADSARREYEVIRELRDRVSVGVAQKTGVIGFTVTTESPVLSHALAVRLLAELDRYNLERRQSQAAAERRFAEQRLAQARQELQAAEVRLQAFMQQNRVFQSPQLSFEHDRLMRELNLREQLYAAIAEAYEQAKLDEVRDTPVITIVDGPVQPVRPDPRGLARNGLLGLVLGSALALAWVVVRELRRARAADARF